MSTIEAKRDLEGSGHSTNQRVLKYVSETRGRFKSKKGQKGNRSKGKIPTPNVTVNDRLRSPIFRQMLEKLDLDSLQQP